MAAAKPRLLYANRCQGEIRDDSLDQLLPPEHPVRDLWQFVETLDLSAILTEIRALPGQAGAPAIDPRILMALWLQATIDGVGSSRKLAELCVNHLVYRWLCGTVPVGYHTLADFRTGHGAALDELLTQTVAALMHEGLIQLQRVAQDGLRVRAAAGAASFHRGTTIAKCLVEAQQQVEALRAQADEDNGAASRREQAARRRAATERVARLQAAQAELAKMQAANAARSRTLQKDADELRASTTDPECRKMKMPDGGFRPAYNVQFATTTAGGVIVGVDVTNAGTDGGQMTPMLEQIEERFDARPNEVLVDGGFVKVEAIDDAERNGTTVYAPPKEEQKQLDAGQDPYARKKSDTDATAEWRARMGTAEAKTIYKERASTAEWVNAQTRNHGLYGVRVRGRPKVLMVVLWYALAHNYGRMKALRQKQAEETARLAQEAMASAS
jgi:transposase